MPWPHTFANLSGTIPAAYLDQNFDAAVLQTDFDVLDAAVAALPANTTPLGPTAGGDDGAAATLSRSDHRHPPQPATPAVKTGDYTMTAADDGLVIEMDVAAAEDVVFPNTLAVGMGGLVTQVGAGQATFVAGSGTTLRQADSYTHTRTQWSVVSWYVRANPGGTAAEIVLSGDMVA